MNKLLAIITLSLSACSLMGGKDETPVTIPTPVRNCVQQPVDESIPKNEQIKCKRGDWQQIGDPVCSSTEAICLKKKF
jgi:hypothetical protein